MTREEAIYRLKNMAWLYGSVEREQNIEAIDMAIEALQTEVVRCKDCKHWYADADTGMACEFTNMSQPEDGYCNWGERKGGEDE